MAAAVVLGSAGAALDYVRAQDVQTKLQAAADAAALTAANAEMQGEKKSKAKGEDMFWKNAVFDGETRKGISLKVNPNKDGFAVVEAGFDVQTTLLTFVGVDKIPVRAHAEASVGGGSYTDINFLVDVTGSMNIADGLDQIAKMESVFNPYGGQACAFACHEVGSEGDGLDLTSRQTGIEIARANGVYLREDRIRDALARMIGTLNSKGGGKIRAAVSTFNNDITKVSELTRDLEELKAYASKIAGETEGTFLTEIIDDYADQLGNGGTGSKDSPRSIVVLITDGLDYSFDGEFLPRAFDGNNCDLLKRKGHDVFVLNIKYPDPDSFKNADWKREHVKGIYADVQKGLRTCASGENYYEADYGETVDNALKTIASDITEGRLRLTQ